MTLTTEELPQKPPAPPFYVDDDGDICDAEGWLVCCPAYDVWPDRSRVSQDICAALNENAALRAEVEKLREAKGLLGELLDAFDEHIALPDANCSCPIYFPCGVCVKYSLARDVANRVRAALGEGG